MKRRDLINLLNNAAATLENYHSISEHEVDIVIEDLVSTADLLEKEQDNDHTRPTI